jgi:hypothetical protein
MGWKDQNGFVSEGEGAAGAAPMPPMARQQLKTRNQQRRKTGIESPWNTY